MATKKPAEKAKDSPKPETPKTVYTPENDPAIWGKDYKPKK